MLDLFGQEHRPPVIAVYHDESGTFGCDRWCLIGLLWVNCDAQDKVVWQLMEIREKHSYWGEIHFHDLPGSFGGEYGSDARVARDWLHLYIAELSNTIWFNALAVDTQHKVYTPARFAHGFHAYNRFSAMALYAGLKWHFPGAQRICLKIYSDEKARRPGGILGDGIRTDNFEEYVCNRLKADVLRDSRAPEVVIEGPIRPVRIPQHRTKVDIKPEEEIMQLCDLILGCVSSAICMRSKTRTKTWFAKAIAPMIRESREPPWKQDPRLYRRFSVSYFPDDRGQVYNDGQLKVIEPPGQLRMFPE